MWIRFENYKYLDLIYLIKEKDIYLKRLHNSKNKEKKELYINSDSQNDISTLLKKPLQRKEALNLKKQKFNLLEAYNTGSSNNMNKFNVSKKVMPLIVIAIKSALI